ncbi:MULTISPECIES: hypothetical protein [unclassified Novosphingobium]|uniref:hypothetical protein n=1 Tax=unclassified Novosphingobium TaxID=2644732 RepID=UPI000D3089DF|nr:MULTISPECIES: hypothetical protein [unclassified Novosphingobium]PTR11790.1 hypothetical protein C8K11_104149 [Novosphingobium sp. GV055]PUB04830.1 hypothetical protein C8K12_104149 [Novosphingobium sp. GV061]PUB21149.1 hypothetical protein C8K14_104149 [Novosphingobium sp. GV079]PUB42875.1 hypothetical protein C8K10_104149 [Novosphingobium sp. GV027]
MSPENLRQRTRAAILAVKTAFGAPGDYGYGTKQGAALAGLYDLFNEMAAFALLAQHETQENDETLEQRLASCLAAVVDTPLLELFDPVGGYQTKMAVYLGALQPELSERACLLLEEAGI